MENRDFRITKTSREFIEEKGPIFPSVKGASSLYRDSSLLAFNYNEKIKKEGLSEFISPAKLHASAILHYIYQTVLDKQTKSGEHAGFFSRRVPTVLSDEGLESSLSLYEKLFPSPALEEARPDGAKRVVENLRGFFIYQLLIQNPALLKAAKPLLSLTSPPSSFRALSSVLSSFPKDDLRDGRPNTNDLFTFLNLPARLFPNSLEAQIKYIIREWGAFLGEDLIRLLKISLDYIKEEEKPAFSPGPPPTNVVDYSSEEFEGEAFSSDTDWMPNVVMMAKCTYVWLSQLSRFYGRPITKLSDIPDEELDSLRDRGFTALWLIGLWERSEASKKIKALCGNAEAEASAYSLKDYNISGAIGGWEALENLKRRCSERGIRLASDMVPNHTGIDSAWIYNHTDYFISQSYPPFPSYTYNGPDLSSNPSYEIKIEDHYYDRSDAAVTFMMRKKSTGETLYIFHGNDGTNMPWNDTAQLDFLKSETREAVIQEILHVARNFKIIRFDAAMTLAKRHIRRLWYPNPGSGGDIAGRAQYALRDKDFDEKFQTEFWRDVVDRVAKEVPDTLLLAEAFWLMEGYFVRTLGMHRVYNSSFMNMLKNQENQKYRESIKKTLAFEPEILKRYVNFMSNPDEETAIAQFGSDDRYFAVCTLLSTLPGLPMFGHGQLEGFCEKYGMEYKKAYYEEFPNLNLIEEHKKRIFPLLKKRFLFSEVALFQLYDCYNEGASVEESVFAFVNGRAEERVLVLVNNRYERVSGTINLASPKLKKETGEKVEIKLADNLGLTFSGKTFALFDLFATGETFIFPSISIFDEGFNFSLSGYEAKVFWNIREVEDTDGNIEKLWRENEGRGIRNFDKLFRLIKISPIYKALDALRSKDSFALIKSLCDGTLTRRKLKALLLKIAECYSSLPEMWQTLPASSFEQVDFYPKELIPSVVVKVMKTLSSVFSDAKYKSFKSFSSIEPALPLIIASFLTLYPFGVNKDATEVLKKKDALLLSSFFEDLTPSLTESEVNEALSLSSVLLSSPFYWDADPSSSLKRLLSDTSVMRIARVNEYEGILWYNKEALQEIIVLSSLGWALMPTNKDFDPDPFIALCLEKEINASYRFTSFLESL